jgi:hypothetical protein
MDGVITDVCVVHELYLYLFLCAKGVMLFIIGKKKKYHLLHCHILCLPN